MTRWAESSPTSRRMERSTSARTTTTRRNRALSASAAQVVDTDKIFGRDNTLTVGTSLDYGWTHYTGNSQLGTITFTDNAYPLTASPFIIDEPDSFLNPIDVRANNTYVGVYALDTFDATDRLTLTGGARFNFAGINLEGTNDALLSGYSDYFHLNPTVGLTYKITPDVNFYARICDDQSHADAARARLRQPH